MVATNLNKQRAVWQLNIKSYKTFLGVLGLNQLTKMNFKKAFSGLKENEHNSKWNRATLIQKTKTLLRAEELQF